MSDLAFNVWGAVAAVIGTITLFPTFFIWFRTRLPAALLPGFIFTFYETEGLFVRAILEGVFTDEGELDRFNTNLGSAYTQMLDIRARVHSAKMFRENVNDWREGLSGQITALCEELNFIQAKLADRSSQERKRLASENCVPDLPLLSDHRAMRARSLASQHMSRLPNPLSLLGRDACPQTVLEKWAYPSWGLHDTMGGSTDHSVEQSSGQPTHHLISDEDLQSLLSVALSFMTVDSESQRAARPSDVLLELGRKLYYVPPPSDDATSPASINRRRLRELVRVVKRIYGMRLHAHVKDTSPHVHIDPESLVPFTADIGECEDSHESIDI
ncbi:hypothetical protein GY45DRAFT_613722 [Cubamyces sp. BRFM 1775]|nr:hypothetical protein GY45DRAFT_613722 [Cubamyces sp. BRFM 1775]